MAGDPGIRHRIAIQARAVRTRIAVWVVLLTALGLLGAGTAAFVVVDDRLDERIGDAIRQEIAEFETLRTEGIDPRSGRPFHSAESLMFTALERNIPDENETIVVFLDGEPAYQSQAARPRYEKLHEDPAFRRAVLRLLPAGGSRRVETGLGEVIMAVKPVNDPQTDGAYVPVYFPGDERAEFESLMRTYAFAAGIALVIVAAGAWLVAGRLLKPLRDMRSTAQEITDSDLSRRLDITGNDDITELGNTFNAMLERLELSFAHQRRFLDDAGHELRTPLTIVRGHLELLDPQSANDSKATRDLVLDELDRMARLVDDMIVLAKAGRPDFLHMRDVDAAVLTDEVLDKVRALGDRDWQLDARAEGVVCVDPQRVTQALVQLAKNATQHTVAGDVVALGSALDGDRVRWWVRDSGPGVPPEDAERVFERFQRGEDARGTEGSGLGLSIVRAIAVAHGGEARLEPRAAGKGATFTVELPVSPRREVSEVS